MSEVYIESGSIETRRFPGRADDAPGLSSAVSWSAILAGAAGAAALSLLLLILGSGLGLSAVSPWTLEGISATTFGFAAIAWLTFTQIAASGMGGYLAGRLRSRWTSVHGDEVFFRDTAHGFLTWAVASLITVTLISSVAGSIVSGGVRAGAAVAGGAAGAVGTAAETAADSAATLVAGGSGSGDANATIQYFVDSLFRRDAAGSSREARDLAREVAEIPVAELTRIFMQGLRTGALPEEDKRYVGRLITERTGLGRQEAEQRVSQGFEEVRDILEKAETTAREAADEAREASAYAALWMFVALLVGAFTASLMAVFGGRQRDTWDSHPVA